MECRPHVSHRYPDMSESVACIWVAARGARMHCHYRVIRVSPQCLKYRGGYVCALNFNGYLTGLSLLDVC